MSDRRGRYVQAVSTREYEYGPTERARMLGEIARRKRTSDRNRRVAAVAGVLLTITAASWVLRAPKTPPSIEAPRVGLLADGSRVTADDGASWVVHEVTAARIQIDVPTGRVRFEVSRRPERDFVVTARDVAVTVVGTVFSVDVGPDGVRVDVEEGRVRVRRGDGSEKVLVVGETLSIASERAVETGAATQVPPAPLDVRRPTTRTPTAPPGPQPADGLPSQPEPTFASMVAEGDALQTRGETAAAVRTWAQAIEQFPMEPGRAVLAFRRAKLMLQALNDAAGAAEAFARLESLGAAAPLVEDALAREVEAWAAAENFERARARASEFVTRYPTSYRRATVERAAGLVP